MNIPHLLVREIHIERQQTNIDYCYVKVSAKDGQNLMAGEHIVNFGYTSSCKSK